MAQFEDKAQRLDPVAISTRDVVFECPSCGKSLVVDEAAQGLIVDCPQCHINVIVPPKPTASSSAASHAAVAPNMQSASAPAGAGSTDLAELNERLASLGGQLRELQAQRTEINNRLASRVNEINRDLVLIARLETSHQQIMSEWNQIVAQLAASSSPTAVVGSSVRTGRSRVQFGA